MMKADRQVLSNMEDILFKNERMSALVGCLQMLLSEGCVDIVGLPENALSYSLYEIEDGLNENSSKLRGLIEGTKIA